VPATAPKHEYQRAEVRRMLHLSERQLQAWQRAGLVRPAEAYSFRDLSALRTIRDLRSHRIPLRVIGRALDSLKSLLAGVHDPLAELKVFSDGRHIAVRVAGQNMEALTGQILLDFDTSEPARVRPLPPQPPPAPRERESEAWFQKGLVLEETGAPVEQVVEAYLQAVECNPQASGALVNLGTIYYRLARFQDAEVYYARALASDPNYPLAHFNLGNLYDERGDLAAAQQSYEAALRINERYGDAHFNLALLCERRGDALKALHHWQTYLKIDSTSEWAVIARRQLEKLRVALLS
jgi:Tfp pilus assembly protein PilF/DNA-binding transcriptional MerR regulator